jgi:energy-coupling factor transporter ATP-binding protein EcfA2
MRLRAFKRFDDLTIDLGDNPARVVALVGPNGCGKSSVFDAFEEKLKDAKGARQQEPAWFFHKFSFHPDATLRTDAYDKHQAIQITFTGDAQGVTKKSFHIRSAYRFTPSLNVSSITTQPSILDDNRRPHSSIAIDNRLQENYERLLGLAYDEFDHGKKTGDEVRSELLGRINALLDEVLDVRVASIGNVRTGKGQLYFDKADAKNFPYQNLSSGEKEVIDIVVDLVVRSPDFDDTIYSIDEPELHLNTAVQRKLLVSIERLIPADCQLWVATHSIGFLRALQDELADKCAVLDFSEKNYFQGTHIIKPIESTRAHWQRIFSTALDDLVGLIAPERIIYCEGRPDPAPTGDEQGLDAIIYNEAFGKKYPNTLFISSGGTHQVKANGSLALKILSKAFSGVELLLLHDRDVKTDEERRAWIAKAPHHRMLGRREIENYIFDFEVLNAYCASKGLALDRGSYGAIVTNLAMQDLKAGQTTASLKKLCAESAMSNADFKQVLARHIRGTSAFDDLDAAIFGTALASAPALALPAIATALGVEDT